MRTLYIDTSSSFLYSAIIEDNKILGEIKEEYGQSLSEVALPRIVSIFNDNNIKPEDIDKIIVVIFFALSVKKLVVATNNKNKAWYIWYRTPVSKEVNCCSDKTAFKAWAPKAPKIIEINPNTIAILISLILIVDFFCKYNYFKQQEN